MTERRRRSPAMLDDVALGAALAELGAFVDFPPTPPIAVTVARALHGEAPPRPSFRFGRPLRRALALGLVAALLVAGLAAAIGFALGGLRISFGEPPPGSPLPERLLIERAFGERTTLEEAAERLAFAPVVPTLPWLGDPDHVYVAEPPAGGSLALIWGARPGLPEDPESGIGLVVTEFRADIGPETFEKPLNAGVVVESVILNGSTGYWIEGGEHFFFYRDANGQVVEGTLRLVGNTLVWEEDGVTLRIEGAPNLAGAVRIAESLVTVR